MSDNPSSPLLGNEATGEQEQSRSQQANGTKRSNGSSGHDESTPLLSDDRGERQYDGTAAGDGDSTASARRLQDFDIDDGKGSKRRWPSIVALTGLCVVLVVVLGLGFAVPAAVEEYAQEAAVFTPTNLSIKNFTTQGVEARIQGEFRLDASKVHKKSVRDLGRAGTWFAGAVESKQSKAEAFLPEYDDILLGSAEIPPVKVNVRNGHNTSIDIVASLKPGDFKDIRHLAKLWLEGQLKDLRVKGRAKVPLKSGIFNLGTQVIEQTLLFKGSGGQDGAPVLPKYEITKLNFHEVELPESQKGMAADVVVEVQNNYPVTLNIPPMAFEIMVPNCAPHQPYILLANATTGMIRARPEEVMKANVSGIIHNLPDVLTTICPNSKSSPLDSILGNYISGADSTIFVRGAQQPLPDTPTWISELIKDIIVPLPVPGHSFDGLIRQFSLAKVHFSLPDPTAEPDSPEGKPRISAVVIAIANLPKEMNFPIDVGRVRATAEVYYKGKKLGNLDLQQWQKANATHIDAHDDVQAGLKVQSVVEDAPLEVTDDDVFTDVVQRILFSGKGVLLEIKAKVDIETKTALGKFVVRDVPAKGTVPIKPLPGKGVGGFSPKVGDLKILDTTATTILFEAKVNVSNPTNYSANVPFVDINLLCNGSYLGHATAKDVRVVPGDNDLILVRAIWDPAKNSTPGAFDQGRELLSQYISGYNTSITLQTFNGSIPTLPHLGTALSIFKVDIPTPKLATPKNPNHPEGDDDRDKEAPRFLDDATFHFLSSSATFTLLSPLPHTTVSIETIDATAYYNHTDPIGQIIYDIPFAVPPGATTSPRLPVDWSLDGVGYEAVKQAIGGTLKLEATAEVGVSVGSWTQNVWFRGKGIGARVQW